MTDSDSDSSLRDFFLVPSSTCQKQYEALRCVFIDGVSQKAAAERFGYQHGAFRQLVLQFRQRLAQGEPPPFFTKAPCEPSRPRPTPPSRSTRPSPMSAP